MDPESYDAWYHTRRGAWIGNTEFRLLMKMLNPAQNASVLDVGCGTGYFTRRFAGAGFHVTGIDVDANMLAYAQAQSRHIPYVRASATQLPFKDNAFDYVMAITSLCFIQEPLTAIREMRRVCRTSVLLGLLNQRSLLYKDKRDKGAYQGARWDTPGGVKQWGEQMQPPTEPRLGTGVFFAKGHWLARLMEHALPNQLPWGSFIAVSFPKSSDSRLRDTTPTP
ncbi:MAG TPA: class I SAM-dependent methyltransferase [Gammaproteobacteria bacterium]